MIVCPECGHQNPDNTEYCKECGRNLKTSIVKSNGNPIVTRTLYKLDKRTGEMRISKTRVMSLTTFSVIFLFVVLVGLFAPQSPIWAFMILGALFGAIFGLIVYLAGYIVAGLIEKINFL